MLVYLQSFMKLSAYLLTLSYLQCPIIIIIAKGNNPVNESQIKSIFKLIRALSNVSLHTKFHEARFIFTKVIVFTRSNNNYYCKGL